MVVPYTKLFLKQVSQLQPVGGLEGGEGNEMRGRIQKVDLDFDLSVTERGPQL